MVFVVWNFSNRFQNFMLGWKLGTALKKLHVNVKVLTILCVVIYMFAQVFIVLCNMVSQEVSTKKVCVYVCMFPWQRNASL